MKPKLYQYAACPFCNKVRSILQYKGVDFETIEVHPLKKKEIAFSEYKAVPIYVDSKGTQVNDSTPIMRRIDEEFPAPAVFSREPAAKEEEDKWLAWSETFVKGLPAAIYDSVPNALRSFDYITRVGKFSWLEKMTIKFTGAFVMTLVAGKIRKREGITDPAVFLRQKAAEWAEGLKGRPFLGGMNPNGADLAVFGITRSVAGLPAGKVLDENPVFEDWCRRMSLAVSGIKLPA
ncbi:MAG TPA: glutathione S-transferase N-terminal domain-containing protein [Verrucomicrobiae bacterium]|jgi:microsomal prostaglandin-E synthase 2|nr:glutathione S-transferase N-terminal domain-containing protein [Verrucomicrobiae bacterium]